MKIENVSTLKIHKLTREQYENAVKNNALDDNAIYLTPSENTEKDYALKSDLETKADLVDGKVPISQLPDDIGGGSSGVTSWNDLEDKPFGESDNSIIWDGTPTDEFIEEDEGVGFYKVSDTYCDADALIGKTLTIFDRTINDISTTTIISAENIFTELGDGCFAVMVHDIPVILVTFEATIVGEIKFPSAGTWFISTPEMFVNFLEIIDIKQLDPKFIPNYFGEAEVVWEDIKNKPFGESGLYITQEDVNSATTYVSAEVEGMEVRYCKVAEPYNGTLVNAKIRIGDDKEIIIGLDDDFPCTELDTGSSYIIYALNMCEDNEDVTIEELGISSLVIPQKGLYVLDCTVVGGALEYFQTPDYEIKQIDIKYLPISLDGSVSLDDYYTKDETDNLIENMNLSDYYTKSEVDNKMSNIDLSNYYTKTEMDNLIGDCDSIINSINIIVGGASI